MKAFSIALAAVALLMCQACAQKNVPPAIQRSFDSQYPSARSVDWEQEDEGRWEAEFKNNGSELSAEYDAEGNLLFTKWSIDENDVPAAVREALEQLYNGYEIEEADKVEMADGSMAYELEIEKSGDEWEVMFTPDGELIEKRHEMKEHEGSEKDPE